MKERSGTCRVRNEREEPRKNLHQTHPSWYERPRCDSLVELEEAHRERRQCYLVFIVLTFIYTVNTKKTSGDFSTVLYEVISKRSSVIEGSMSIDEVNAILDEISKDLGKQYAELVSTLIDTTHLRLEKFSLRFFREFTTRQLQRSRDGSLESYWKVRKWLILVRSELSIRKTWTSVSKKRPSFQSSIQTLTTFLILVLIWRRLHMSYGTQIGGSEKRSLITISNHFSTLTSSLG